MYEFFGLLRPSSERKALLGSETIRFGCRQEQVQESQI